MIHEYIIKVDDDKKDIVGGMPLIDKPQELVRCKDCKYALLNGDSDSMLCELSGRYHRFDWYCADGERKVDKR